MSADGGYTEEQREADDRRDRLFNIFLWPTATVLFLTVIGMFAFMIAYL